MRPKLLALAALACLLTAAPGCLTLGPDYERPPLPDQPPLAWSAAPLADQAYAAQGRWWEHFNDPELDRLVERALARNQDMAQAAARVMELEAAYGISRAERWPHVNLQGTASKSRANAGASALGVYLGPQSTESYNLSLAASFELDLWGRLARLEEAARAELLSADETRLTVAQGVVAGVVTTYLQIESLERRLQVSAQSRQAYRKSVDLVEGRYRRGLATVLEVRQARRTLAEAEAQVPQLEQELAKAQQALKVLTGDYPAIAPARAQPDDYFPELTQVPAGLPSALLARRPDVRAAEANLKSLNARVGAALAARFPSITLTGSWGYASSDLHTLIEPANELWSLSAGLLQPLFNAGLLEQRQRAAEARLAQGVAAWAKTVLEAFQEVEAALLTRQKQLARRGLVRNALAEARATQRVAQDRYLRGLVGYLDVLEAQQTRYRLESELVLTELSILTNRVTLHRALGGDWAQPQQARKAAAGSQS